MKYFLFASLLLGFSISACASTDVDAQDHEQAPCFAISDVRVFDGRQAREAWTVLVSDHHIQAAGPDIDVPEACKVIDGNGKTLLPGLIDSHVHTWGAALKQSLALGVTTVLDMFTTPEVVKAGIERRNTLAPQQKSDLFSSGILATAPGGHGTEYGIDIPTLSGSQDAKAFVEARIAQGSDYIKIIYDDGKPPANRFPSISEETLKALVDAAHAHDMMAVVHAQDINSARTAIEAGADGLVHVFADKVADEQFLEMIKESGAFVIPTLSVIESIAGTGEQIALLEDPNIAPYLSARAKAGLGNQYSDTPRPQIIERAIENVRLLHEAGVPILAGTDAPNTGTAFGASLHREILLYTRAGMSNAEALASATSVPAEQFDLERRGRIAEGMLADLVLVSGNPLENIKATRDIVTIWKDGYPVDRDQDEGLPAAPKAPEAGLISDFESGKADAAFGVGWQTSTDQLRGGKSVVKQAIISPGAEGSQFALQLTGEIKAGFPFPWAGVMYYPGAQPMQPVDFSGRDALVFQAKGQGETYRVMVFSGAGFMPVQVTFTAGPEWETVELPLSGFQGADFGHLKAILFSVGSEVGEFQFAIDEVTIR